MRVLTLCLGIGIMLAAACGGGGSGTSKGRDSLTGFCTGSATLTCTGDSAAYAQCVATSCNAEATAAFGSGYSSGTFAGVCGAMMKCQLACPCDATATTCESKCYQTAMANTTCLDALTALQTCTTTAGCTTPSCTPNTTGTGTGAGTGTGSCAAAQACCTAMAGSAGSAAVASACAQVASYGEATCAQVLSAWHQAGLCN